MVKMAGFMDTINQAIGESKAAIGNSINLAGLGAYTAAGVPDMNVPLGGAALGALTGAVVSDEDKLRNALLGALIGGSAGYGATVGGGLALKGGQTADELSRAHPGDTTRFITELLNHKNQGAWLGGLAGGGGAALLAAGGNRLLEDREEADKRRV